MFNGNRNHSKKQLTCWFVIHMMCTSFLILSPCFDMVMSISKQKLPHGNRDRYGKSTFRYGDHHIETVTTISKQKLPYGNRDRHGKSTFQYGDHHIETVMTISEQKLPYSHRD